VRTGAHKAKDPPNVSHLMRVEIRAAVKN
jgi:hypothetical protein